MGCEYAWQDRAVVKTFTGFVSGDAFVATAEAVAAHPRFDTLRIIYNDFTGIPGHSIDAAIYGRIFACRLGSMATNPNFRVVFIAGDAQAEALCRAVQPWRRGAPFDPIICATLAEAHAWFAQQAPLDSPRGFPWHPAPATTATSIR